MRMEEIYIGYWILNTGYWILDIGYWILDIGYWILDTKHGRTVDIIVFSSLDRAILVRVETKRTKRSERKTCWMIVVEDPSLLALNGSLKSRRCWESIFDEFKHGLRVIASLGGIQGRKQVKLTELFQAVLYRLEGDRLMQMPLQMSKPNMQIQDKDIVEDHADYYNNQTITANGPLRAIEPLKTMNSLGTMN
ncbi:hypothetical protein EDC96DRAFT_596018 [Choanephora cucurbitarum]|nr:hypothetical protein EDC96DRAFT_596018 [Choanephora cucurbitarum]